MSQKSVEDAWGDEFERWTPRRVKVWALVLVLIFIVAPLATWGLKVAFSGPQGRGDQIIKNNGEVNRTGKQEMFEELYADIKGYKVQIANSEDAVKGNTDPKDEGRLKSVVTGIKNQCVSVVEQYNAESHKITSQDWKDYRLPYEINPSEYCSGATK